MRAKRELTQIIFLFLVFLVLMALRPAGSVGAMTAPLSSPAATAALDSDSSPF